MIGYFLFYGFISVIASLIFYGVFLGPMLQSKKLTKELVALLPTFNYPIKALSLHTDDISITFGEVKFYMELQAGLAENGIYAYNAITLYGIGTGQDVYFEKGQNVFKAWVEFKKFHELCKQNGVKLLISRYFEDEYKEFKKQVESLNNLKVLEANEKAK